MILNNKVDKNNKHIYLLSSKIKEFSNDTSDLNFIKTFDPIKSDDYILIILKLN